MPIQKILIVDDTDPGLLFFEMILKDMGHAEIVTAKSGTHGLSIIEQNQAQMVICAWEIPGISGTSFIQKARATRRRKYMPCVLYSKRMNPEDVACARELGFRDILGMPLDRNEAKTLLKRVIHEENNLDPHEVTLRKMEGYLAEGKAHDALRLSSPQLQQPGPFMLRALTVMSEIWLAVSRPDRCEESLQKALADDPTYYPALRLLARLYSRRGQHAEAVATLERMSEGSPKNLATLVQLGSAYVDADRHEDAHKIFAKVAKIDAQHRELKDEMGKLAFKEGNISLAAELISETENGSEIARYFNNLAVSLVVSEEYEQAIEYYSKAIQLIGKKVQTPLLHYNLGLAFKKCGNTARALKSLCDAYLMDPAYEKAYAAFGKIVLELRAKGEPYDRELTSKVKAARDAWVAEQANPKPPIAS